MEGRKSLFEIGKLELMRCAPPDRSRFRVWGIATDPDKWTRVPSFVAVISKGEAVP